MQPPSREQRSAEARRLLEGLNGQWVAERLGVSDATIGAWRRGDRVPDLGDLLVMAIAVGRRLDPAMRQQVSELLDAGELQVPATPAVIEEAEKEARDLLDDETRRAGGFRSKRPGGRAGEGGGG